jgi:UDP:flavonoid glycosyltransferase YjiC (YdhE family)
VSCIAFLTLPEPGHILPTLRVAELLRAQGHEVFYFVPPELEPFFRSRGFQCQLMLEAILPRRGTDNLFGVTFGDITMDLVCAHLKATGTKIFDLLVPDLRTRDFDLLLCDPTISCGHDLMLGQQLGRPVITLNTSFLEPEQIPPHHREGTQIVLCPREFGIPPNDRAALAEDGWIFYGEPSLFRGRGTMPFPWNDIRDTSQLIYCGFGSQIARYPEAPRVIQAIMEACSRLPSCQLVVAAGDLLASLNSVPIPPDTVLVRTAPQLDLLARAKLFITHGGPAGVKEGIMSGVPMLVIPFDLDQPGNACRVEYHSLGLCCPPTDCDPQTIRYLLSDISSNRHITNGMNRMQAIFLEREAQAPAVRFIASRL